MSDYIASNLSSVLNSTPIEEYNVAYGQTSKAIAFFGGLQPKKGRFQWLVASDENSTVGPFTQSTSWTTGDTIGRNKVTADPQGYHVRVQVENRDVVMANNGAFDGLPNYVEDEMVKGIEQLYNKVDVSIQSTDSTTGAIESLADVLATPTGSGNYYDTARSSNAWANAASVSASDGQQLLLSHLEEADRQLKVDRKTTYDTVLMSTNNYKRYEKILRDSGSFTGYKDVSRSDIAFEALRFRNANVIEFPQLPDTTVYFCMADDGEVWYEPQSYVDMETNTVRTDGIFKIEQMGQTGPQKVYVGSTYLQFIFKNPWRTAVIYNLSSPSL